MTDMNRPNGDRAPATFEYDQAKTAEVRECYVMSGEGLDFKRVAEQRGLDFDEWLVGREAAIRAHERIQHAKRIGQAIEDEPHRGGIDLFNPDHLAAYTDAARIALTTKATP